MGKYKKEKQPKKVTKYKESERNHSRFWFLWWGIGTFLLGAVVTLYVVKWFVMLLPGPNATAEVISFSPIDGPYVGCSIHQVILTTDEPIEYIYFKAQFPDKITGHKVGFMYETIETSKRGTFVHKEKIERNIKGECYVSEALINPEGVQFSATGNMLTIHYSKLIPHTRIAGIIATTRGDSAPLKMFIKGEYEYVKLDQAVRKQLKIMDHGVKTLHFE